jgi:hypothetical protein
MLRTLVTLLPVTALALGCMSKSGDDDDDDDDDGSADSGWTDEDDGGSGGGGSGGGSGGDDGGGSGGDPSLCDGGAGIFHTVGDTVEELGSSVSGTIEGGSLTFCSGYEYDVDLQLEGNVTLASSDARSGDTVLVGSGIRARDGSNVVMTGFTLYGMSEWAISVYEAVLTIEDVVITGGTAGVYVDSDGELIAEELRIVDNVLGDDNAMLRCGGGCQISRSELSGNDDDSYADKLISLSARSWLILTDTDIEYNTPFLQVIDVSGGRLDIDGGTIAYNETYYTTIDAGCGSSDEDSRVDATARIGGNVSEGSGSLFRCGCNGEYETTANYGSPSNRTLRCN